jgi:hypothetical protein
MIWSVLILLLLSIVVVFSVINIIKDHRLQNELDENGRYVVAMIRYYRNDTGKDKNKVAEGHFYLDDIEHSMTLYPDKRDAPPVGRVYLKVLVSHPEVYEPIYYERVPPCYDNEGSMRQIWDELPVCP